MVTFDLEVSEESITEDTDAMAGLALTNIIEGQVISASDNQPINNADVGLVNTNKRTKTNESGEFSMETAGSGETIVAYADGYTSNTSMITDNEKVTIQLRSAPVTVAGRMAQPAAMEETDNGREKRTVDAAAAIEATTPTNPVPVPEIPIDQYHQYLRENLEYPAQATQDGIAGTVILEITVDARGAISNITILLGLGYGCDEEARRLIQEGPGWNSAIINGTPTEAVAQIAVHFSLD